MSPRRWRLPPRGSLVWRLSWVGLGQLALVALFASGWSWLASRLSHHWATHNLSSLLAPVTDSAHRAELNKVLGELARSRDLELTIYDEEQKVLASSVTPPLSLPRFGGGDRPEGPDRPPRRPLHDRDGTRIDRGPPGPPRELDDHSSFDDRDPGGRAAPPGERHGDGPPHGPPPGERGALVNGEAPPPPNQFVPIEHGGEVYLLVTHFSRGSSFAWGPVLTVLAGLVIVASGAFLLVRWIARPIDRLTQVAQALGEGDLRARAELTRNDELGELGKAFDEMAARMQRLLTAERELLANVSHELRTPLARIKVALDLAVEGGAEAAKIAIEEIALDLAELETLVEDVLQATRFALEGGHAPMSGFALRLEDLTPKELADSAAQRFVAHHPARALHVRIAGGLPNLRVDPQLLRRVLGNLLENAHKYSPDPATPIDLHVEAAHDVRFVVQDRGIGIPTEELPRVFDPFYRSERSRHRGTGGVGLGLTLARRVVEAHGGTIEIGRGVDGGTRVAVTLPASPVT